MQKIYIFENTDSLHIEESLVTIYKVFKNKYEIKFCLNSKALNRVKNNNEIINNMIDISKVDSLISFVNNVNKEDIVIYPTISARNIIILYLMSFFIHKNIYYIRNANSWLRYTTHQNKFSFKVISKTTTFFKKKLLKKAFQIFVANSNLKNYLEKNKINKVVNIVPYKFFDENNYKSSRYTNKLRVVIPGGIDISKKDLPLIRESVNNLVPGIKDKLEIILLGKPSRDEDLKFCQEWKKEIGESVKYFTAFIPDSEFSNILKESHFILGILTINYEDKYNKETYGITKDTGVDAQAIAYGKPLIINQEFEVANEISTSSIGFKNSHDLTVIIEKLINNSNYNELSLKAMQNSRAISLEKIRKNLKGI